MQEMKLRNGGFQIREIQELHRPGPSFDLEQSLIRNTGFVWITRYSDSCLDRLPIWKALNEAFYLERGAYLNQGLLLDESGESSR